MTALFLFTHDLRLTDNPGLASAARDHAQIIPAYVLDESDPWAPGGANRWWLYHSLKSLAHDLDAAGGRLLLKRGDYVDSVIDLAQTLNVKAVYFSRAYEPWLSEQQYSIRQKLGQLGIDCKRFAGRLLLEPEQIHNQQGKPFQVFTPFYKHALKTYTMAPPITKPALNLLIPKTKGDLLSSWNLLPKRPNWAKSFIEQWQPGESGAQKTLQEDLEDIIQHYPDLRDLPAAAGTSKLSPALHFGEISPRQIWHQAKNNSPHAELSEPFLRQIMWREFSYYLLHHWPSIPTQPFKEKFGHFPWHKSKNNLTAWQQGKTGYPIVDAGMRELWQTGWMHNRVRMIVASFLTKHLRIHWLEGAKWFWDTLVDADLANNSAGWQWVAGSGADAAPYFRIFNPILQGEKFDSRGDYIRRWVPELKSLPSKFIHQPWQASQPELKKANVTLGGNYPFPIVDHKAAREEALYAYKQI